MAGKNKTGESIGVLINGITISGKWVDWKIVENKRGRGQQAAFREPELKLKNKYSILADEPNLEKETVLIGDSIVRNKCIHFGNKKPESKKKGRMLWRNKIKKYHRYNKRHKIKRQK